jgi:hypothetical protein
LFRLAPNQRYTLIYEQNCQEGRNCGDVLGFKWNISSYENSEMNIHHHYSLDRNITYIDQQGSQSKSHGVEFFGVKERPNGHVICCIAWIKRQNLTKTKVIKE